MQTRIIGKTKTSELLLGFRARQASAESGQSAGAPDPVSRGPHAAGKEGEFRRRERREQKKVRRSRLAESAPSFKRRKKRKRSASGSWAASQSPGPGVTQGPCGHARSSGPGLKRQREKDKRQQSGLLGSAGREGTFRHSSSLAGCSGSGSAFVSDSFEQARPDASLFGEPVRLH